MTKSEFIRLYEAKLRLKYDWASKEEKLIRYMQSVCSSLNGGIKTWNHEGECVTAAWRELGGKGTPTFKQLCNLL